MADVHVRIEITSGGQAALSKAVREMQERDRDFPSLTDGQTWWRKPPNNPRGALARCLSKHGLTGKLSVVEHVEGTEWDAIPPPQWTGFTAKA